MVASLTVWTSVRPPVPAVKAGSAGDGTVTTRERIASPSMDTVSSEPAEVLLTVTVNWCSPDRNCSGGASVAMTLSP